MASKTVRYFALTGLDGNTSSAYNVFREVINEKGHFLERLDSKDPNKWIHDAALGRYIFRGEPGAEEITEQQARAFVELRGGTLTPP